MTRRKEWRDRALALLAVVVVCGLILFSLSRTEGVRAHFENKAVQR